MTNEPTDWKPPSVLHLSAVDVAGHALDLLDQLEQDLAWAHSVAYGDSRLVARDPGPPAEPDPARAPAPPTTDDPDHVPGPKLDIGHGDARCRGAYLAALPRLAKVEAALDQAVIVVGARRRQPVKLKPTASSSRATVNAAIAGIRWRLTTLRTDLVAADDLTAKRAKRHLLKAWSGLNAATLALAAPFAKDQRVELDETRRCTICQIRPMAMRLKKLKKNRGWRMVPAKGGRCHTCSAWYLDQRNKGRERPRSLDSVDDAKDAQRRRLERGEGWGDA